MASYKVLIHGIDTTSKIASVEFMYWQNVVVNYIDGSVASFNRADVKLIDESGKDVAKPIKLNGDN